MSDAIFAGLPFAMNNSPQSLDDHLQIVGNIFQSVGISAVIWGADALIYHGLIAIKSRNDLILPNEDFLRAAEALRLHNFIALEPVPGSPYYLDGLEHYAAQYLYPSEVTARAGTDLTVALFPATLVGWKLVYLPIPDIRDRGSFTTSLGIQKIPTTIDPEVEQSFVQLSRSSSTSDIPGMMSVTSDDSNSAISACDRDETDDEFVVIPRYANARTVSAARRGSVPMERGNGPKSPEESVCDIVDMRPEPGTGAVEMLPGQKMLEKSDGQLIMIDKGMYVPRTEGLRESFKSAGEFLGRDNCGGTKFAKALEGWKILLGGRNL